MYRGKVNCLIRVIITFLIAGSCLFGYINVNSKEVSFSYTDFMVIRSGRDDMAKKIVEEEPEQEVIPETLEEVVPVYEPVVQEVVSAPVVSEPAPVIVGDSIEVAGVTKNLMKDVDGSHFYLNHNINGVYDGLGVPYVDFRYDFTGRKTIIYSHSTKAGNGPFQALQNYHNNPSFYSNHRTIEISYQGNHYTYEIFSVYVSVADSEESKGLEYFHREYYTASQWGEALQYYKEQSEYDTGVSVSQYDKILILQTCSMDNQYFEKYYRYNLLVMGKLVG